MTFLLHVAFSKRNLKSNVITSWTYSTLLGIFKTSNIIKTNINLFENCDIKLCCTLWSRESAQKMKLSIKYFFSKCNHIRSFLRIWSHLLKKILIENLIFCAARQPINCYEIFFRYSTFCQVLGRRRKCNYCA